jgi:hypothetical protein
VQPFRAKLWDLPARVLVTVLIFGASCLVAIRMDVQQHAYAFLGVIAVISLFGVGIHYFYARIWVGWARMVSSEVSEVESRQEARTRVHSLSSEMGTNVEEIRKATAQQINKLSSVANLDDFEVHWRLVNITTESLILEAADSTAAIVQEVVNNILSLERQSLRYFANERTDFQKVAQEYAIAVFDDDRDQLARMLVKNTFKRLGFHVLDVVSRHADDDLEDHFSLDKADLVVVGGKVSEELLSRYLQEVYQWGKPRLFSVGEMGQGYAELASQFSFVLSGFSEEFGRTVILQIWLSLKFWQVQSYQRRRLFVGRPGSHDRATSHED